MVVIPKQGAKPLPVLDFPDTAQLALDGPPKTTVEDFGTPKADQTGLCVELP